jgi:two-component system LytT family response regulator
MIKSVIIDDEPLARSIVKEYLQDDSEIEVIQECGDGFEGVKAIMQHKPDVVFLDIQMPKITGFEMLELIDFPVSVIFTTAYDEYAIKAFEAHAVDYLLKPFSKERFNKALKKWKEQHVTTDIKSNTTALLEDSQKQPEEQSRVVVKNGNNIKIIPVGDIHYVEAYDDYVKIYTKDGYSLKKKTMNYFEQTFNPQQFVRVHRSYILQIQQITKIETLEKDSHIALLKTGAKIPLSKTGYVKLKTVLGL